MTFKNNDYFFYGFMNKFAEMENINLYYNLNDDPAIKKRRLQNILKRGIGGGIIGSVLGGLIGKGLGNTLEGIPIGGIIGSGIGNFSAVMESPESIQKKIMEQHR